VVVGLDHAAEVLAPRRRLVSAVDLDRRTTPLGVDPPLAPAVVEIVVPVYNEAPGLEASIRRLHAYLAASFPLPWSITLADNASTDATLAIARALADELPSIAVVHLAERGRGRALRAAWTASDAPVLAYMDVDLSTGLDALLPLVAPLVSGHSDLSIGTRLATGSRVVRGPKREVVSRAYNLLLRSTLRSGFSDAQCGFKAVRAEVARDLLPLVEDEDWFFDTELLLVAERSGLRIHEVPVDWADDPDSRVDIVRTALADLRGIWRLLRTELRRDLGVEREPMPRAPLDPRLASQLARFASIGVVSTAVFAVLFAVLAPEVGPVPADVIAVVVCAAANTAANRRLTFALRGRAGRARHHLGGLLIGVLPLVASLLAIAGLGRAGVTSTGTLLLVLTVLSGACALARFVLLRRWVFR
jgi:putative flippase GtrA